ncbi:MAG: TlpA disulfide reductase family protein [Proteobacteria bacterium]|nr:TlpA disulfide reductase family protein [Pseudomonadota bacterium]
MTPTASTLARTLLCSVALAGVALQTSCDAQVAAAAACTKGAADCIPDVNYVDTHGTAYTAQTLKNKIVLVNFWATWCKPCEREIPDISKAYEKYKDKGVVFLGVLYDQADEDAVLNFASDHEMTYPIVRSTSDIMTAYQYPEKFPTTFVFDRSGRKILEKVGGVTLADLARTIEPKL